MCRVSFIHTRISRTASAAKPKALNPHEWQQFPLQEKIKISPNTAM